MVAYTWKNQSRWWHGKMVEKYIQHYSMLWFFTWHKISFLNRGARGLNFNSIWVILYLSSIIHRIIQNNSPLMRAVSICNYELNLMQTSWINWYFSLWIEETCIEQPFEIETMGLQINDRKLCLFQSFARTRK